jgi:hypothetical protein
MRTVSENTTDASQASIAVVQRTRRAKRCGLRRRTGLFMGGRQYRSISSQPD